MLNKVLFINQHAGFIGGLEKYIYSVSKLLRANGFQTALLYVEKVNESEKFFTEFDEVFNVGELEKMDAINYAPATLHKISEPDVLKKILAKFSPAAFIHDHDYFCPKGYKYYPFKRINCRRPYSRIPCGICASIVPPRHMAEGFLAMLEKNFIKSARLNALVKTCRKYVVLSEFMKNCLVKNGIAESEIKVIHPFLFETPYVEKTENKTPEIIFAGQQVMSKGITLLLDAAKQMKGDAKIKILGSGARLDYFKSLSGEMGLAGKVDFEGWVKNPDRYFARADIAVFPSLWQEPFGLSGIEAMSRGIPVVGFDVGGVSEWLKDGVNGILVPERDTAAMAAALDTLIADAPLRKILGENAKKFVENTYTPQKFLESFITLT